jgi:hypothetical protein
MHSSLNKKAIFIGAIINRFDDGFKTMLFIIVVWTMELSCEPTSLIFRSNFFSKKLGILLKCTPKKAISLSFFGCS